MAARPSPSLFRPHAALAPLAAPGLVVVMLACSGGREAAPPLSACSDPRPQACTRDYRPACGHRCAAPPCDPEQRHTYGNACDACADVRVVAVTPGRCGEPGLAAPPTLP